MCASQFVNYVQLLMTIYIMQSFWPLLQCMRFHLWITCKCWSSSTPNCIIIEWLFTVFWYTKLVLKTGESRFITVLNYLAIGSAIILTTSAIWIVVIKLKMWDCCMYVCTITSAYMQYHYFDHFDHCCSAIWIVIIKLKMGDCGTAILTIFEGRFPIFQRFSSSKLVLKTVKSRFVALNYYENGSMYLVSQVPIQAFLNTDISMFQSTSLSTYSYQHMHTYAYAYISGPGMTPSRLLHTGKPGYVLITGCPGCLLITVCFRAPGSRLFSRVSGSRLFSRAHNHAWPCNLYVQGLVAARSFQLESTCWA